jgi:hypothetical protein
VHVQTTTTRSCRGKRTTAVVNSASSLFTCCYLLASAFHRLYWLPLTSSFDPAFLSDLRGYLGPVLGVGRGQLHANCSSGDG